MNSRGKNVMLPAIPILLAVAFDAQAVEVFKWVDQEENVHYSDMQPVEQKEVIDIPEQPSTPSQVEKTGLRPAEAELLKEIEQREAEAAEKAREREIQAAKEAEERAAKCREFTEIYETIRTQSQWQAARTLDDNRLRFDRYRRAKRYEYGKKVEEYCDRGEP